MKKKRIGKALKENSTFQTVTGSVQWLTHDDGHFCFVVFVIVLPRPWKKQKPCDTWRLLNSSETDGTLRLKLEVQGKNSPANFSR